jgi:hypothetical protein
MFDKQTSHPQWDAIALISRDPALPQRFGYHAEHSATIQLLPSSLDGVYT